MEKYTQVLLPESAARTTTSQRVDCADQVHMNTFLIVAIPMNREEATCVKTVENSENIATKKRKKPNNLHPHTPTTTITLLYYNQCKNIISTFTHSKL